MANKQVNSLQESVECFDMKYREDGMSSQRSYPNESMIQFLASRYFSTPMEERKDIRVLEVGSGSGANLWMIAKEGFDAYGLDSSKTGLELARTHLEEKWGVEANLQAGTFTKLPYEDDLFDAVVDVVSLQHISLADSNKALLEITRVLKPKGCFFSYRLSDQSVMFRNNTSDLIDEATISNIDDPNMPLANNGPISFWSPSLVQSMYSAARLVVLGIETVTRTYTDGQAVEYLSINARSI
jgi:ubiquinone/menaquinone biosynthesis C-methylase UbiE